MVYWRGYKSSVMDSVAILAVIALFLSLRVSEAAFTPFPSLWSPTSEWGSIHYHHRRAEFDQKTTHNCGDGGSDNHYWSNRIDTKNDAQHLATLSLSEDNTRRHMLTAVAATTIISSLLGLPTSPVHAIQSELSSSTSLMSSYNRTQQYTERITVPLTYNGQEFFIYYRVDGSLFRAIIDTGSPFLLIPGTCGTNTRYKSGCYKNQGISLANSGFPPTYEIFDGFEGEVEWRSAPFWFVNATGSLIGPPRIIFGVASESILSGTGGVFFGLLRDTDTWIRPSFLSQTNVRSIQLNLVTNKLDASGPNTIKSIKGNNVVEATPTLTLSTGPMIDPTNQNYIPLINDLRRKYGDPVNHYTARAEEMLVNGYPLVVGTSRKPIYVIFDTGVSGMVVSLDLFNERYTIARERRERNLWGFVELKFRTASGESCTLAATKPLTTPLDIRSTTWKRFRGHLIVVGLAFLTDNKVTIDIDDEKLLIEPP